MLYFVWINCSFEQFERMINLMKGTIMDKFTKRTAGFVIQTFEKNHKEQFVCTHQEFVAGDQCDYFNDQYALILRGGVPEYKYQPYTMTLQE